MRIRPRVTRLFRLALRRPALREADVDEEIRLHVDLRAEQLVRGGWPAEAARVEARRRFGLDDDARPRLLDAARDRDTRLTLRDRLDSLRQDLGFALRQLRVAPGVAVAAVLTLALGVGANAAMFGVVDRLLLRPPVGVAEPGRVVRLYVERVRHGGWGERVDAAESYPAFVALRAGTPALLTAAYFPADVVVGAGDGARRARAVQATGAFLGMLGARPALGRLLSPDDDVVPSGRRVAVLSDRYWRAALGADPRAVGRSLVVEGRRYEIVGVAAPGFNGIDLEPVDLFLPLSAISADTREAGWDRFEGMTWIRVVGRLRPGATTALAESQATAALRAHAPDSAALDWRARVLAAPVAEARAPGRHDRGASARIATWLTGVAAVVLLIACANVSNLLLARAERRRREIAVRTALGAGRGRLARQLLTETAVLAAAGGALGVALAAAVAGPLRRALLPDVDWSGAAVDARVLAFAAAATLATAALAGLAPLAQLARGDVTRGLRTGVREGGGRGARTRTGLLLAQSTLSIVLLVGAGLFVRSLARVAALPYGYDADRLVIVDATFADGTSDEAGADAYDRMLARARRLPGVERAAIATTAPFWSALTGRLVVPGADSAATDPSEPTFYNAVTEDYFATMGNRVVRGRAFGPGDVAGAPRVVVVNEVLARRLWPGADPLGRCVKAGAPDGPCSEVVGVVRPMVLNDLRETPQMQYYTARAQRKSRGGMTTMMVRTAGPPAAVLPTLRRELARAAPEARYLDVRTLESRLDPQRRPWRLGATMFGAFGALALLIASVGLYSVLAYTVAGRMHEMGLRMALGARARDVVRLVAGQGLAIAAAGVALGLAIALAAGRWIAPLLFDVSARDPAVLAGVVLTLFAAALLATVVPARRATRASPGDALRAE